LIAKYTSKHCLFVELWILDLVKFHVQNKGFGNQARLYNFTEDFMLLYYYWLKIEPYCGSKLYKG